MNTLWPPDLVPPDDNEGRLWLQWLVRLRWVAIFAQVVTLSFSFGILTSPLLVLPLLGVSALLAFANLYAARRVSDTEHPIEDHTLLAQLGLDVVALTTFFALCGGPDNTFTLLYLIHVAMGAVMLGPRSAAALTVGVLACYCLIHVVHLPLHLERHVIPERQLFRIGQLLSMTITALSVSVFVVGLATTLRMRKRRLLEAQARSAQTDRLRSVGTLAAGAAHELNTPLSTMGLRVRRLRRRHEDDDTQKDLSVIREQLTRCSSIVERLLVGAGDPSATGMERVRLADAARDAVRLWSKGTKLDVRLDSESSVEVELPRVAFEQGLINLLENAREAQHEIANHTPLRVYIREEGGNAVLSVYDRGVGLPTETQRIGDPFFTTKSKGTGLGVFVARAVAVGAGGGLDYFSTAGTTEARFWVPIARRSDDGPRTQR